MNDELYKWAIISFVVVVLSVAVYEVICELLRSRKRRRYDVFTPPKRRR